MFLFVASAFLVSRNFGHLVQLFLFFFVLITAFVAWIEEDSATVPIFQNWCENDNAVFDTVTCTTNYGCRVPIANDTIVAASGVPVLVNQETRGSATPTVYNRSGTLTAGYECQAQNEVPVGQTIVWGLLILFSGLVLLAKFMLYVVYKAVIKKPCINLASWYGLQQTGKNRWTYRCFVCCS